MSLESLTKTWRVVLVGTTLYGAQFGFAVATKASAACTGGSAIKGSFGVVINGPAAHGGSELYVGLLTFNGACAVTGTLTGGISISPTATRSVTGTYSYSAPASGYSTLSLSLAGVSAPLTFGFNPVSKGAELVGVESDNVAVATIDLVKQTAKTFSNASISGAFSQTCYGATGKIAGDELDFTTYDGAGGAESTVFLGPPSVPFKYSVTSAGIFTETNLPPYASFPSTGVIVGNGTEHLIVVSNINGSGVGYPVETCIEKQ
jgi:hypothetical protein